MRLRRRAQQKGTSPPGPGRRGPERDELHPSVLRALFHFGGPSALAALAQGLGLVQLIILAGGGLDRQTDAFFFLATWILLPGQMLTSGMLYPVWLRGQSLTPRSERFWRFAVPVFSAAAALIAGSLFVALAEGYPGLWIDVCLAAAWGAVAAVVMNRTMRASSSGDPTWLAGSNIIPNALGCVALVLSAGSTGGPGPVTSVLAAQVAGNLLFLGSTWSRTSPHLVPADGAAVPVLRGAGGWFFLQAVVGYGAILALQTQAASLAAAALSIIGLISRVTAALNNLVTNAVLPRLIHTGASSGRSAVVYVTRVSQAGIAVSPFLAIAMLCGLDPDVVVAASVVAAWFCACTVNIGMKRLAARELDPRISVLSAGLNLAVPLVVLAVTVAGHLSVAIVLIALVMLDFLPALALSLVTRRRVLAASCTIAVTLLSGLAVWGAMR